MARIRVASSSNGQSLHGFLEGEFKMIEKTINILLTISAMILLAFTTVISPTPLAFLVLLLLLFLIATLNNGNKEDGKSGN